VCRRGGACEGGSSSSIEGSTGMDSFKKFLSRGEQVGGEREKGRSAENLAVPWEPRILRVAKYGGIKDGARYLF